MRQNLLEKFEKKEGAELVINRSKETEVGRALEKNLDKEIVSTASRIRRASLVTIHQSPK